MDIELGPGPSGIEATEQLVRTHPQVPVLIVSTYGAVSDVQSAVSAGALGYLLKDASAEELRHAVAQTTVKTHLNHIFGKLGVGNRTEAVTVARARHLIRG